MAHSDEIGGQANVVYSGEIGGQAAGSVDVEESPIEVVDGLGDTQFDDDTHLMPNEDDDDPSFAFPSGRVLLSREEMATFLYQRELERKREKEWQQSLRLKRSEMEGWVGSAESETREFLNCTEKVMQPTEILDPIQVRRRGFWYRQGEYVNPIVKAADYLCTEDEIDGCGGPQEEHCARAPKPSREFLEYQQILIEAYYSGVVSGEKGPMKLNKRGGVSKDWRDCVFIYNFCLKNNCHSDSKGNELLTLIRAICENHGVVLPLHKDWRSLQRAVEKKLGDLHELYRYVWTLPAPVFGSDGLDKAPLKPVTAVSYDILKNIAFHILRVDRKDFADVPPTLQFERGSRVVEGFETSDLFIRLCAAVKKEKGPNARPLCISVGWDESVNRGRTISTTPLVFSFMQVSGASAAIHLGGYFPNGLAQSDKELFSLIKKVTKCKQVGLREQAIADAKRKFLLAFPHSVLAPFIHHEEKGFLLQVGTGSTAEVLHVFPFICTWMMDNEAGDELCGTNFKRKGMKCRVCCDQECFSMPETSLGEFVVRDSALMSKITSKSEAITTQKNLARRKASAVVGAEWKEVEEERVFFGLSPGENPNYVFTKWAEDRGLYSFHVIVPPDSLHTFLKGLIEAVISSSILLIHAFDVVLGTDGLVLLAVHSSSAPAIASPNTPFSFSMTFSILLDLRPCGPFSCFLLFFSISIFMTQSCWYHYLSNPWLLKIGGPSTTTSKMDQFIKKYKCRKNVHRFINGTIS